MSNNRITGANVLLLIGFVAALIANKIDHCSEEKYF